MSDSNRGERSEALATQGHNPPGDQQGPAGAQGYQGQDGKPNTPFVQQSPSQSISSEQQSQAQTEQPAPHVLSDLAAQQTMAETSYWMALAALGTMVVSVVGTFFLAWQVRLTREAVQDTGDATKAMVRSNEMAEATNRPWLSIAAKPQKLARKGYGLFVEIDLITTNLGQMVAANYQLRFKFEWINSTISAFDHVEEILASFDPGDQPSRKVVLPGDAEVFPFWSAKSVGGMESVPSLFGEDGRVAGILVVSAFYKTHEDDRDWHRTDKAYVIGWKVTGGFTSVVTDKFRRVGQDKLVLKELMSATLAN